MSNPVEVHGVEDVPLPMHQAWINSLSTPVENRPFAGLLCHGHCTTTVCGTCLGSEEPRDGKPLSEDHIQMTHSVLYGRLFLAEGYLTCNPIVDDTHTNFDVVSEGEEERRALR